MGFYNIGKEVTIASIMAIAILAVLARKIAKKRLWKIYFVNFEKAKRAMRI